MPGLRDAPSAPISGTTQFEVVFEANHQGAYKIISVPKKGPKDIRSIQGTWKRHGAQVSLHLPSASYLDMDFKFNSENHSLVQTSNGAGTWINVAPRQIPKSATAKQVLTGGKWRTEKLGSSADASGRRFEAYDQLEFLPDGTVISSELLAVGRSTVDEHAFKWKLLPGNRLMLEGRYVCSFKIENHRLRIGSTDLAHFNTGVFVRE